MRLYVRIIDESHRTSILWPYSLVSGLTTLLASIAAHWKRRIRMKTTHRGIPLALKVIYLVWVLLWLPFYWSHYGPQNQLWMCDVAGIVLLFGLWLESPLLLSSQAVGVLIVQIVWSADFVGALLCGIHPVGGTEYMFDTSLPLLLRSMSLFHICLLYTSPSPRD